jgi:hypothetical protein
MCALAVSFACLRASVGTGAGTAALVGAQWLTGRWIFSWANFYAEDGSLAIPKCAAGRAGSRQRR